MIVSDCRSALSVSMSIACRMKWMFEPGLFLSLISLLVTLYVAWQARNISRLLMMKGRLPGIAKDLSSINRKLGDHLGQKDSHRETDHLFADLDGLMLNVGRSTLPSPERSMAYGIRRKIRPKPVFNFRKLRNVSELTRDDRWDIYNDSVSLHSSIKNLQKNDKWS